MKHYSRIISEDSEYIADTVATEIQNLLLKLNLWAGEMCIDRYDSGSASYTTTIIEDSDEESSSWCHYTLFYVMYNKTQNKYYVSFQKGKQPGEKGEGTILVEAVVNAIKSSTESLKLELQQINNIISLLED